MADARVTSVGVYAETDPVNQARVTTVGAYAETDPVNQVNVTAVGVYVETQKPFPAVTGGGAGTGTGTTRAASTTSRSGASGGGASVRTRTPSVINPQSVITGQGGAGYVQWRAYIGPPFLPDTDAAFWDWTVLQGGAAYTPISATTLATTVDLSTDTTITLTDASAFPSEGGLWLGPNAAGESWGYVRYSAKSGNDLTVDTVDTIDAEYSGQHTAGATAQFWWTLDTATADFDFDHDMDDNLSAVGWRGHLRGIVAPVAALRTGHLCLVQVRWLNATGTGWDAWENLLVGWLRSPNIRGSADKLRPWDVEVVGLNGMLDTVEVTGIKVGDDDAAQRGTATASSTLTADYKEAGSGEFTKADPDLSAASAIDGDDDTLWLADRYVGEDNPLSTSAYNQNNSNGIRDTRGVTGFHINPYTGQGDGYRWINLTAFADTTLADWVIAGVNKFVNMEGTGPTASEGEHVVLAENPSLFSEENTDIDGTVVDLADFTIWDLNNQKYTVDNGGATGGTFTLTVDSQTTASIAYDASAEDIETALEALSSVGTDNVYVTGDAASDWSVTFVNDLGSENGPGMSLGTDSTTGGTGVTVTQDSAGGAAFATAEDGTAIFDYMPVAGGILRTLEGPTQQGQSQAVWGTEEGFAGWNPGWSGSAMAAPATGESARMIFDGGGTPTDTADWWEVGDVATPGYHVESGDLEWWLLELPSMGLSLTEDITAADPPNGGDLLISDAAGPSVDGLDPSGTVQVGSEQITYTGKLSDGSGVTGITRGANSTTAAAHSEGDTVYAVESGVAVDALAIKEISLVRPSGLMVLEDFVVRRGRLSNARNPDDTNYTNDYYDNTTETGNALTTYTIDLSSSPERIRWILLEVSKMSTQPARPRINTVKALVDENTYAGGRLVDATVAAAMTQILDDAGVPSAAITDNGDTETVNHYTTQTDNAWPVLVDMADMLATRLKVARDSTVTIAADPYWADTNFVPAEASELGRVDVGEVRYVKTSGRTVGQVELWWRTPDSEDAQQATYPSSRDEWGRVVTIGSETAPYVFASQAVADMAAQKHYFRLRRGYTVVAQVASEDGETYGPGEVRGLQWDLHDDDAAHDRTYLTSGAAHAIVNFGWDTTLRLLQISREDEK